MERLRILFLAADPGSMGQVNAGREAREIREKLRVAAHRDAIELVERFAVRPGDLQQTFFEVRPHVVHFSGHGTPGEELVLEGDDGGAEPLGKRALAELFRVHKDTIRVVVLSACHSRPQVEAIAEHVECAIGMRRAVGRSAATEFSAAFYLAIGFGASVQMAFESGIAELRARGIPEDHTPQLVVRPGTDATRVILLGPTDAPDALDAGEIERPPDAWERRVAEVLASRDRIAVSRLEPDDTRGFVDSGFPLFGGGAHIDDPGVFPGAREQVEAMGEARGARQAAPALNRQFQSGGTLGAGAVYVTRKADDELPRALLAGELAYVLAPRQMGKSSLRVRTEARLREAGVRCASVDLSALGSEGLTADAWCFGIADELSRRLDGKDPSSAWKQLRRLSPAARLFRLVRRELLDASPEPLVIFFDEIDSVLSLSFSSDDFFATIRSVYNARADDPPCARLAFCFLGVATPADLMRNTSRTPFNVGRGIRLDDFVRAEAQQLAAGLGDSAAHADAVLDVVFEWTLGHPYMAQRICETLAREGLDASVPIRVQVARIVGQLFLQRGRVEDSSLAAMDRLFADRRTKKRLLPMLDLYARLLDDEHVMAVGNDPVQAALRLAGLAAERDDGAMLWLQVRNPIVAAVFDHAWVAERRAWLSTPGTGARRRPAPSGRRGP